MRFAPKHDVIRSTFSGRDWGLLYTAPELLGQQSQQRGGSTAGDVHAWGVVAYELLTHRLLTAMMDEEAGESEHDALVAYANRWAG